MPFQKGNPGRQKGTISQKTRDWEKLGEFITEQGAKRLMEIMETCSDDDFLRYYDRFLEYFKPKQQRTVHANDEENPLMPKGIKVEIVPPGETD